MTSTLRCRCSSSRSCMGALKREGASTSHLMFQHCALHVPYKFDLPGNTSRISRSPNKADPTQNARLGPWPLVLILWTLLDSCCQFHHSLWPCQFRNNPEYRIYKVYKLTKHKSGPGLIVSYCFKRVNSHSCDLSCPFPVGWYHEAATLQPTVRNNRMS